MRLTGFQHHVKHVHWSCEVFVLLHFSVFGKRCQMKHICTDYLVLHNILFHKLVVSDYNQISDRIELGYRDSRSFSNGQYCNWQTTSFCFFKNSFQSFTILSLNWEVSQNNDISSLATKYNFTIHLNRVNFVICAPFSTENTGDLFFKF